MIKALIIDDQEVNISVLRSQLGKFFPQITVAAVSTHPLEAVALIQDTLPDLLFLDINMPGVDGFGLLELLGDTDAEVIFVTAFSDYALKAFEYQASGYLTKPVSAEKLVLAVNKAIRGIEDKRHPELEPAPVHPSGKLALSTQKGLIFVDTESIYYCESGGNYTTFFLEEEKQIVVSKQIGHFEQLLSKDHFVRIHDRYIINLKYIREYHRGSGGSVVLDNEKELPVSTRRKDGLLKYFG